MFDVGLAAASAGPDAGRRCVKDFTQSIAAAFDGLTDFLARDSVAVAD